MTTTRPIILLLGPTAGGKTTVSIRLAELLPGGGECVSADSMQVYRGMDIGTATPDLPERRGIPHHMLDVADPAAPWTVDDWLRGAEAAIDDIRSREKWPIVVGGTNLYVQALLFGLVDGPEPDPELRAALRGMPPEALRAELQRRDPAAANRIHPNDLRRTIRALEYARGTGEALSAAQIQWTEACRKDVVIVGLQWPTDLINRRINARVAAMMQDGLLAEVQALHERGSLGPQAAAAVGYAQILDHLEGRCTLDEAVEQIKIKTRRLGKQQRTWLRRFQVLPNLTWVDAPTMDPEPIAQQSLTAALAWKADGGGPEGQSEL
ncbi:MAG: tRNA (adenosine(37)-N6)-dimethylallyltransferase MiaA [Phycisphaerales bacterium]|jgi:tRNA dimethylallyltransferase|nr:tRNA (adenosine(37)-N6)-dimethylallyltransferase MiaA [Phycisphaerales bacterium]